MDSCPLVTSLGLRQNGPCAKRQEVEMHTMIVRLGLVAFGFATLFLIFSVYH